MIQQESRVKVADNSGCSREDTTIAVFTYIKILQ